MRGFLEIFSVLGICAAQQGIVKRPPGAQSVRGEYSGRNYVLRERERKLQSHQDWRDDRKREGCGLKFRHVNALFTVTVKSTFIGFIHFLSHFKGLVHVFRRTFVACPSPSSC